MIHTDRSGYKSKHAFQLIVRRIQWSPYWKKSNMSNEFPIARFLFAEQQTLLVQIIVKCFGSGKMFDTSVTVVDRFTICYQTISIPLVDFCRNFINLPGLWAKNAI